MMMAWTWSCWSSWHPCATLHYLCYGVPCWPRVRACSSFSAPSSQPWQTQQCRLNQPFVTTSVFRDSLCCLHTGCTMLTQPDSPQWHRLPLCWKTQSVTPCAEALRVSLLLALSLLSRFGQPPVSSLWCQRLSAVPSVRVHNRNAEHA